VPAVQGLQIVGADHETEAGTGISGCQALHKIISPAVAVFTAVGVPTFQSGMSGDGSADQFIALLKTEHGNVFEAMAVVGEKCRLGDRLQGKDPFGDMQMTKVKGIKPSADKGCGILWNEQGSLPRISQRTWQAGVIPWIRDSGNSGVQSSAWLPWHCLDGDGGSRYNRARLGQGGQDYPAR